MVAQKRRKLRLGRLLLIVILILAFFNLGNIARFCYPLPYRETIETNAAKYNIDPLFLAALIKTESNFNPNARSPKGARGLMQIMPETGIWIAEQMEERDFHPDKLYDIETNIQMGAWYVSNLMQEFDNDPLLMLAAYNGGRGNVNKWLAEKDWSEKNLTISQIPFPETQDFVQKVFRYHRIYQFLY